MAEVTLPTEIRSCDHVAQDGNNRGMFGKEKIRDCDFIQTALKQPCALCNLVYPSWKLQTDSNSYYPHSGASSVSDLSIVSSVSGFVPDSTNKSYTHENSPGALALTFIKGLEVERVTANLSKGQLGEAYHVLICGLIFQNMEKKILRVYIDKDEETKEIRNLLSWYGISTKPNRPPSLRTTGTSTKPESKKNPTRVVGAAFRASNRSDDMNNPDNPSQPALFSLVRNNLKTPAGDEHTDGCHQKYFHPTYAAKYWLNRYLSLTKQQKLPKNNDEMGRLAVIHIRRDALSAVGRVMDERNLKYVAKSIADANECALAVKESRFTHIILYGDFDHDEASQLKDKVKTALEPKKSRFRRGEKKGPKLKKQNPQEKEAKEVKEVKVLFICRPWKTVSKNRKGENGEVFELWKKFRDIEFDCLPVQVKILAIWTTLCERYHPKICIIGHRSGFIEGAGFIGIPIFYLNNERKNFNQGNIPGKYLWGVIENPQHDRLREVADVMNTIIPVESLESESESELGPLAPILRAEGNYKNDLSAALFMFMCCNLKSETSESSSPGFQFLPGKAPGWVARINMMHDSKKEDIPHTGQDWLRKRYEFAISKIEAEDSKTKTEKKSAPTAEDIQNSHWTGMKTKWKSRDDTLLGESIGTTTTQESPAEEDTGTTVVRNLRTPLITASKVILHKLFPFRSKTY